MGAKLLLGGGEPQDLVKESQIRSSMVAANRVLMMTDEYLADSSSRRNTLIRRCWSGTSAELGHSGDGKAGDAVARASTGGES